MPAVSHPDRVDVLECVEKYGTIVRLVRRVRITGLSDTDYKALYSALTTTGVPAIGSKLTGTGFESLVCTERSVRIVEEEPSVADINCTYELGYNEGQDMRAPPFSIVLSSQSVSLNQVTSNTDKDGNTVTVSHTFPAADADFPSVTKQQAAEFQYFQAQPTLRVQGIRRGVGPWLVAQQITGALNDTTWGGTPAGTWMCTTCSWEPYNLSTQQSYKFTFEFQYNPDGWDPTVVYIDERTGKPPKDLLEGTGYKTVQKHRRVNFNSLIGAVVQGS